jgi:2-C-methyl-D-erythritol 4-phosphate cytidylyltransferase
MEYQAIVLAAGNSTRSGLQYNKVLFELNNTPIIYLSTKNFINDMSCNRIFLVCKENDLEDLKKIFNGIDKIEFIIGGETRQESVNNALKLVTSEYVLIHDGARPYFTAILLNRLIAKLKEVDAVIPVWTMTDTVKEVKNGVVVKTLKRDVLKRVQTPQAFKTSVLLQAHNDAKNKLYTDDSSMVEELTDTKVYVIDGEYPNIKYTFKEDF